MMHRLALFLVPLTALSAAAAEPAAKPQPAPAQRVDLASKIPPGVIDVHLARNLVAAGIRVVDVRTPDEYGAGHVHGALNIPVDDLEKRYGEIGPPAAPVLLYCRTGNRSGRAAKILQGKGFTAVYDFQSYDRWVKSEPRKRP